MVTIILFLYAQIFSYSSNFCTKVVFKTVRELLKGIILRKTVFLYNFFGQIDRPLNFTEKTRFEFIQVQIVLFKIHLMANNCNNFCDHNQWKIERSRYFEIHQSQALDMAF